jgi:hypothetical protein
MRTSIRKLVYGLGAAAAAVLLVGIGVTQMGSSAEPLKRYVAPGTHTQRPANVASPANSVTAGCSGGFSDGSSINVGKPTYLQDVPGDQLFCDFHTFAWNQFIYLTQMQADPNNGGQVTPLFLHMAPWYNLLKPTKTPAPTVYPGGSTALSGAPLDQGQAGDDDSLVDVAGNIVQYDIRFNSVMYGAIAGQGLYYKAGYDIACVPAKSSGTCKNPVWLPPTTTGPSSAPVPGAMEIKTAWRDFGSAVACPATQFYCNGRFGLVGMHIVQKTQSHGEWVWMSFEHVANDPDCYPGGDTPIAAQSPIGTSWSFFNPQTAGSGVMGSQMCEVSGATPQCNANPKVSTGPSTFQYVPVNVCRTTPVAPGGASAANCQSVPDGPPVQSSNSPGNVACLNATLMPQLSGVWQNYKMIGSLWVRGTTGPTTPFQIQIFQQPVANEAFGESVGFQHLANTTMETWMQAGSTGYDPFTDNSYQSGCFNCHNLPSSTFGDDLSHYVDKLPAVVLKKRLQELLPADSLKVVKPGPMPIAAAMPVRRAPAPAAPAAYHKAKPAPTPH